MDIIQREKLQIREVVFLKDFFIFPSVNSLKEALEFYPELKGCKCMALEVGIAVERP